MRSILTSQSPLAHPIPSEPVMFTCQACGKLVTREHIHVWERRSYDNIRAKRIRSSQICDTCKPVAEPK